MYELVELDALFNPDVVPAKVRILIFAFVAAELPLPVLTHSSLRRTTAKQASQLQSRPTNDIAFEFDL